jgi:hypothetical protein
LKKRTYAQLLLTLRSQETLLGLLLRACLLQALANFGLLALTFLGLATGFLKRGVS